MHLKKCSAYLFFVATQPDPLRNPPGVHFATFISAKGTNHYPNLLINVQSLYAKKVEVDDYIVFCIAKVEIGDQKFTLLGILGGWWVFEMTSLRSAISGFKSRTMEILETAVSSDM